MKLRRFGPPREEPLAGPPSEAQRVCPQCGASISVHAKTCIHCGTNIAALEAEVRAKEKELQRRKREEVAQIPTRAIAVVVTLVIVVFIVGLVVQRTRESAILALTPTITPTYTPTATPTRTPLPTPTSAFTATPIPPLKITVKPGDVPGSIADYYGISVATLMSFNGKNPDDLIIVGETLMIPIPTPQPTGTVTPVGNAPTEIAPASCESIYKVQSGDTLSTIAVKMRVSEAVIQSRNDIPNPDSLQIGQQLVISTCPTPTPTPPPPAPNATPTSLPSYGSVMLLTPLDGEIIVGNSTPVLLQWLSSGILRNNELYKVEITQVNGGKSDFATTLATSWRVPTTLFPPSGDPNRTFKWKVSIIRQSGTGSDKLPIYNIVSPVSEHTFEWLAAPPTPTPTTTPLPGSTRIP